MELVPTSGATELGADNTRYRRMRNEEYTMELFLAVGLIGAILAGAAGLFEARSSSAASPPPTEMARLEPVRVVGTPFVPNVRPRALAQLAGSGAPAVRTRRSAFCRT
jgi:hypothetical protein